MIVESVLLAVITAGAPAITAAPAAADAMNCLREMDLQFVMFIGALLRMVSVGVAVSWSKFLTCSFPNCAAACLPPQASSCRSRQRMLSDEQSSQVDPRSPPR